MCGIVGLYCKTPELEPSLGAYLSAMLVEMDARGPDSAGVAVYRNPAPEGRTKLTLYSSDPAERWEELGLEVIETRAKHALVLADDEDAERRIRGSAARPTRHERGSCDRDLQGGRTAARLRRRFRLATFEGRMGWATRGWRPRAGSRPRGRTRSRPATTSVSCTTARFFERQPAARAAAPRGDRVPDRERHGGGGCVSHVAVCARARRSRQALEACLDDLDGFYTFLVGTADGFAVLRDPIACKPAVLAETDEWVAMASEYRAIAVLPGASEATIWEPEPSVVYAWEKGAVAA